jgi:hypothetical protein
MSGPHERADTVVEVSTSLRPDELQAMHLAEPRHPADREWRARVTRDRAESELEAMEIELRAQAGVEGLTAGVAAMRAKADAVERDLGPSTAAAIRCRSDELDGRRERMAARVGHIKEQIDAKKKAMRKL